uniref:Uncharacterized protein n=1 Tax=Syphacia muris TaxID=451379 RepID=A0A0N5ANP0_9BILA
MFIILLIATLLNVAVIGWSIMRYNNRVEIAEKIKEKRAKKEAARKKAALARKKANRSVNEKPITRKYERIKNDDVIYDTVAGWIITESSIPAESDSQSVYSDASKKFLYESILEDMLKKKTEKKRRKHEKNCDDMYDSAPETSLDKAEKTDEKLYSTIEVQGEKGNSDSDLPIGKTTSDSKTALGDDLAKPSSELPPLILSKSPAPDLSQSPLLTPRTPMSAVASPLLTSTPPLPTTLPPTLPSSPARVSMLSPVVAAISPLATSVSSFVVPLPYPDNGNFNDSPKAVMSPSQVNESEEEDPSPDENEENSEET